MRETAKRKLASQEATTEQLVFAAMSDVKATLHDAVVAAGMTVLSALLEQERTALCGPRYAHDRGQGASRAGHTDGELAIGGRRASVRRPRVFFNSFSSFFSRGSLATSLLVPARTHFRYPTYADNEITRGGRYTPGSGGARGTEAS